PLTGPATVAGVPIPDTLLEQLRANVTVEPVLVDAHGAPVMVGRRCSAISPKISRSVRLRDGHCRCGNCDIRHGLEIHHLVPRSWGGTDDISNLVAVFAAHHRELIPHGPWALVGNPNQPDGLRRIRYDTLTDHEATQHGLPPPARRSTG
ncbi:MAG TPA: HNH endonuclease signature motif containing protein, partial [Acidimicrobiia bacterium]|nr:HNH endonuclease signature motif containing protein [Acidimicrobiia bacterium]